MLQPPQQRSSRLSADDFATFFQDKVAGIRASTASASQPVIVQRQAPSLRSFEPVTVSEIMKLMTTTPAKSCALDPVPTWLLKQVTTSIAPVICHLCMQSVYAVWYIPNASQTGSSSSTAKEANIGCRHGQFLQTHLQSLMHIKSH